MALGNRSNPFTITSASGSSACSGPAAGPCEWPARSTRPRSVDSLTIRRAFAHKRIRRSLHGNTLTRMVRRIPERPAHPERICWGCERYCAANDLRCGNGKERAQHPIETFGPDWLEFVQSNEEETLPADS